jgi:hypothetical protein
MYWVSVTSAPPRPSEGASPAPAAGGPGGGEGPRAMTPPQRRDTYAMTLEVIG